jgi:CBS domain-containing protein
MNLEPLCQRAIVTIDGHRPIREAAQMMLEHHVGTVVVTEGSEGQQQVVGLVTDRDLALACVARMLDPAQVLVGAIASRPVACIPVTSTAAQAAEAMQAAGVRRLLVRDEQDQVIGLLASDDVLAALVEPLQALVRSVGAGIERERTRSNGAPFAMVDGPLYLRT